MAKGEGGVVEEGREGGGREGGKGKTRCLRGKCRKEERKGVGWWSQLIAPSFHGNARPFPPTPGSFSPLSLPHPLPHFLHIFRSVFPLFVRVCNHVTRFLWPPFSSSFLSHLLLLGPQPPPPRPPPPAPPPLASDLRRVLFGSAPHVLHYNRDDVILRRTARGCLDMREVR